MKTESRALTIGIAGGLACCLLFGLTRYTEYRSKGPQRAREIFVALEREVGAHRSKYFFGDPATRFSAAKDAIRLADAANPEVWNLMDRGTYYAWLFARASLSAEALGLKAEALEYRKVATSSWQKRKQWNSSKQQMAITEPLPPLDQAEKELFEYISAWDQAIRNKQTKE